MNSRVSAGTFLALGDWDPQGLGRSGVTSLPFCPLQTDLPEYPCLPSPPGHVTHRQPRPARPARAFKRSQGPNRRRGSAPHPAKRGPVPAPGHFQTSPPPAPRPGVCGGSGAPLRCPPAPTQPHGTSGRPPSAEPCWGKRPGATARTRGSASHPAPREQALEAPAAASDLLRAAESSSPAAERGEPRPSPVSSGWFCRRASLRFPTDGLAGRRLTPRSARAPALSPAGGFSPRFLYWRQGT